MSETGKELAQRWRTAQHDTAVAHAKKAHAEAELTRAEEQMADAVFGLSALVGQQGTGTNAKSLKLFLVDDGFVLVTCSGGVVFLEVEDAG